MKPRTTTNYNSRGSAMIGVSGQATLEYVLLLFFIISFSTLMTRGILRSYNLSIQKFNGALEKDLKTGKSPIEVFKNDT